MFRILLVEDDATLGETLRERLSTEFIVDWADSKKLAIEFLSSHKNYDLLILDIGLPDGNGFEIAEFIHQNKKNETTNILFLTAQSDAESRLKGYELGAEEFIPKPFHLKELLLRVNHVLQAHVKTNALEINGVKIDFTKLSILKSDGSIEYPANTDIKLLELLISKSPKPVTRDEIMNFIWGEDKNLNIRTIDNAIVRIKKWFNEDSENLIRNVRGIGYQWVYEETKK